MAIGRTTTDLVASIRRRCFMKAADPDFSTDDITAMINEQVGAYLYDLMRPFAQNYAVQTYDQTLVSGQQDYKVPSRAVNGTLEAMAIIDPLGKVPGYRLVQYDLQDSVLLQTIASSVVPVAYSLESNVVRVWPAPITPMAPQNTLRIMYMQRASELVPVASCNVLSSTALSNVTSTTYRINLTATPLFTTGDVVEMVSATPAYSTYSPTATVTAVGANYVDVSGVAPSPYQPVAGDYLCLYDQAPVLTNIPLEFQECLLQWVGVKMMEAKGDQAAMDRMGKALSVSEGNLRKQLSQRNTGQRRFMNAWAGFSGAPVRGLLWPISQPGP